MRIEVSEEYFYQFVDEMLHGSKHKGDYVAVRYQEDGRGEEQINDFVAVGSVVDDVFAEMRLYADTYPGSKFILYSPRREEGLREGSYLEFERQ